MTMQADNLEHLGPSRYAGLQMNDNMRYFPDSNLNSRNQAPRSYLEGPYNSFMGNHVNGRVEFAENGLRDPGLAAAASVYEILEAAEIAIQKKTAEADQLRYALKDAQNELHVMRLEMPRKATSRGGDGCEQDLVLEERCAREANGSQSIESRKLQKDVTRGPQQAHGVASDSRSINTPSKSHGDVLHLSPPSSRSVSPSRHRDADSERTQEAQDVNFRKQDMMLTASRTHEEECRQLRSCLVDAAYKETRMLSEIRMLDRRVAELRMAYDQQQQGLADAASKALSYRQDLVDENMKLTYDLQALEQDRSVYVSSLLPILAEFSLQPPSTDAQSMVGSIRALVQHLKARINITETKLKESGFHRPWHLYPPTSPYNISSPPVQSPSSNGRGLEIVPQGLYPQGQRPASPSSPMNVNAVRAATTGEIMHRDVQELASPLSGHNNFEIESRALVTTGHENGFHHVLAEPEDGEGLGNRNNFGQERIDHGRRSPHLPPLPEEPNQPAPEDGEPLPGVYGLRIVGDAILGSKLTVCGHSINGTALCNFQWTRYYPDGAVGDIDGASQTEYTINADDIDTVIAIQCFPMDDRGRKGDQVTEFANGQSLIQCDQTMEDQINSHIVASHAQFDVTMLVDGADENWEPGTLTLKRSSYEIRRNNIRIVKENYSLSVNVRVVLGQLIQCAITSSDGSEYMLAFRENRVRDRAVLTLRRFRQAALDGKKGKAKGWFGKKA